VSKRYFSDSELAIGRESTKTRTSTSKKNKTLIRFKRGRGAAWDKKGGKNKRHLHDPAEGKGLGESLFQLRRQEAGFRKGKENKEQDYLT